MNELITLNKRKCLAVYVNEFKATFLKYIQNIWAPLHKTMVTLQLMISLQSMVTIIDFLTLIGYGAVLLW